MLRERPLKRDFILKSIAYFAMFVVTREIVSRYIIGTMSALKRFQKFLLSPAEWVLIQEAKLGDKEAFGRLYQLYVDRIYRFVFFRVGQQKEIAEDIVADIFVKVWEKIETFKEGLPAGQGRQGSFQAWVYMIARNRVIDYYRSVKNHTALHEGLIDDTKNVEETVLVGLEIERVKAALAYLTEEQQEVIVLKFIEDVPYREIAVILGKREDAIRALQSRAIKELKKILNS